MAINIKEIFDGDSSSQQIDKINYNFDQILANGGGPTGAKGASGTTGATGATGSQGAQGPIGLQGTPGQYTDFFVVDTDPVSNPDYSTVYVKETGIGSPSVVIGERPAVQNGQVPVYLDTKLKVVGKGLSSDLVRFEVDNGYIDINLTDDGVDRTFKLNPQATGAPNTHYELLGSTIKLISGGSTKVLLSESESIFSSDVKFNGNVKIPTNATTGHVLTAQDAQGTLGWSAPGIVPIGTMVMVPGFILNDTSKVLGWAAGSGSQAGKGINEWAGWYYCWGTTWSGNGDSYITPDMRSRFPMGWDIENVGALPDGVADYPSGSATSNVTITVPDHTHTVTAPSYTLEMQDTGETNVTFNAGVLPNTGAGGEFTTTGSADIKPLATTVGYMIYLEATNLTHS